jgi:hypothetical protein
VAVAAGEFGRSAAEGASLDYKRFYAQLFAPLEDDLGPIDPNTICAIMGFDGGGPLSFNTIGANAGGQFITYVSCELAVRPEQRPTEDLGRFELLCSCDDEQWVRSVLSGLGRMSLSTTLGFGHTIDIGPQVTPDAPLQGVLLTAECCIPIDGELFSVLRVIGITRAEMDYKRAHGSQALQEVLEAGGIFPHTIVSRGSAV